jgi:hypothetical protein
MIWLAFAVPAVAQLEGRFYLDKSRFVVGEPVYLHFEVMNTGKEPVEILAANPYSFCAGYQLKISDGSPPRAHPTPSCTPLGEGGSCASGHGPLRPGERKTEDILLDFKYNLAKPGTYYLTAIRNLPYGTAEDVRGGGPKLSVTAHLEIVMGIGDEASLKAIWQPYLADLTGKDPRKRDEAALVISRVAPLFLEDTIIGMLNSDTTRGLVLPALRKLNTARTRKALADFAAQPGNQYRTLAIHYLGEIGDHTYFPLLLSIAQSSELGEEGKQTVTIAAARLGGDESLPLLLTLLDSNQKMDRIYAVQGMYVSASRKAVPVLIDLLRDRDDFVARMAPGTLVNLTHRSPVRVGPYEKDPTAQYPAWSRWWILHGQTAPIYGPEECGEVEPLE